MRSYNAISFLFWNTCIHCFKLRDRVVPLSLLSMLTWVHRQLVFIVWGTYLNINNSRYSDITSCYNLDIESNKSKNDSKSNIIGCVFLCTTPYFL